MWDASFGDDKDKRTDASTKLTPKIDSVKFCGGIAINSVNTL